MADINRRRFLHTGLGAVAAAGWAARAQAEKLAAPAGPLVVGAGARIGLGVIGCGGRGRENLKQFLKFNQVKCVAICDVDDAMLAETQKQLLAANRPSADMTNDFRRVLDRKDVDIVLIATPDHWHALPSVEACAAGKDVYVEKPLATTIAEGRAMVTATRKYNRVVQVGTQWRSCKHFQDAIAYVHSGKLGKIRQVRTWAYLDWIKSVGRPGNTDPPAGVDYDQWLGPAPKRPFNPARFHFSFRWFWDYAGGLMTDWGVHLINLAHWGMKVDGPTRISAHGGKFALDDISETPDTQCVVYDYPGFIMTWEHQAEGGLAPENHYHGTAFYGKRGKLIVSADHWEVIPEKKSKDIEAEKHDGVRGEGHEDHVRDFLQCVVARKRPVMDIELGHQVTAAAHLGNIALQTGRSIQWDAKTERIVGDEEASRLLTRAYRPPWKLPGLA